MYNYGMLTDQELLKIILSERKDSSQVDKLFEHYGSLKSLLLDLDAHRLTQVPEMGSKKLEQILCLNELLYRINKINLADGYKIQSPQDGMRLLESDLKLRFAQQEHFVVVLLNTKNRVLGVETVTTGTLTSSIVTPREVFKRAISHSCNSIIIGHNHPSGDPHPSSADRDITSNLALAGDLLGIKVLDHIIVGCPKSFSFAENGLL